jgi:hypothetical protein
MFDTLTYGNETAPAPAPWDVPDGPLLARYDDLDAAETELVALEADIARARARQVQILGWLDRVKVTRIQGARTMHEWVIGRLDVTPATARDLISAVRVLNGETPESSTTETLADMGGGEVSFDRAVATMGLVDAGATPDIVVASRGLDLPGVRRQTAATKKMTRADEQTVLRRRFVKLEPTLGDTAYAISGLLPGYDGHLLWEALQQRIDQMPASEPSLRETRTQRMADALTAIALDSLDSVGQPAPGPNPVTGGNGTSSRSGVTVFVDTTTASTTAGEGEPVARIPTGPLIGPDTIDRILCEGTLGAVQLHNGRPVAVTDRTATIPPAVRAAVLLRDGGCVIDGCTSTYRLQPHHIIERSRGGNHDPENLASLCWYHHHIAIHGYRLRIDPTTPPHRRRLTQQPITQTARSP